LLLLPRPHTSRTHPAPPPIHAHARSLNFIPAAARQISRTRIAEATATLTNFVTLNTIITIAACLALVAFYGLWFAPLVRRLDRDIKGVRSLLLLFPDSVSRAVPAILNHGREMLAGSGGSSAGSVA
jgi:hypothetical protein